MNIQRLSLMEGLLKAHGVTVVIDVFRAFTCEPLMYYFGAKKVILESDIERCRTIAPGAVLVGEHNEVPIEGFDLTNSPSLIIKGGTDMFGGKTVVHRTTSGVTGAVKAIERSDEVLLASFANARATARYIASKHPAHVSIVAMGIRSMAKAPEDEYCGDYIESMLAGTPYNHIRALADILAHETAQKFIRGDKDYLPKEDPAICLQRDLFDFALKANLSDGIVTAEQVMVGE